MPRETLDAIPAEKRERVLREAALAFAERGYAQTDMAALARRCGVAKGSLYNYFESKEELYLYVCRDGMERSRAAVWGDADDGWDIYQTIEHTFRRGVDFARAHPEYVALYFNAGASGLEHLLGELMVELEKHTADRLKRLLASAVAGGTVRADLDVNHTAWLINNTYIMMLGALVSPHFHLRMREYLDVRGELTEEEIRGQREATIRLLHSFLRPRGRERKK